MMHYKTLAMTILCLTSGITNPSFAVDESSAGKDAAASEAAVAEFREIICTAAVDVDSPIHQRALKAVENHRYTDARFADFFRDAMENPTADWFDTKRKRESAMRLLPFMSIESVEKTNLLLDALAGEEDGFQVWVVNFQKNEFGFEGFEGVAAPVASIVQVLQRDEESLTSQLKDRLNVDQPMAIYCALARYSRPSPELLSSLLKATHSESPGIQLAAIRSLDSMVLRLEREARSNQVSAVNGEGTLPPVDEKLDAYARKIIGRYDRNADGVLTENEWNVILVDPSPADVDKDGRITVEEYARWMMKRSSR
jgi:hypothetical protein